jgi:ABC-type glycerol-3-phosphate transport system permease component
MSHELVICLIAVAVNLAGMIVIYCAMSHFIARQVSRRYGVFGGIALILIPQLFWIAALIQGCGLVEAQALWLGDWLASAFAIVVLWKSAARVPTALHEAARMDGLGAFAAWRYATLPFVRRDLFILAIFTVMATFLPAWGAMNVLDPYNIKTIFSLIPGNSEVLVRMVVGSLIGAVPLIAIFFAAKKAA